MTYRCQVKSSCVELDSYSINVKKLEVTHSAHNTIFIENFIIIIKLPWRETACVQISVRFSPYLQFYSLWGINPESLGRILYYLCIHLLPYMSRSFLCTYIKWLASYQSPEGKLPLIHFFYHHSCSYLHSCDWAG